MPTRSRRYLSHLERVPQDTSCFVVKSFCFRAPLSRVLHRRSGGTRGIKTQQRLIDGPLSGDVYLFGRRLHLNRFS